MNTLKEKIVSDMKDAMRAKDTQRLGTIRLLLAACKQKEIDERIDLDDIMLIAIIDKLIKQRKDSIVAFEAAARQDLIKVEQDELAVLQSYLPPRLSPEEVESHIAKIVTDLETQLERKLALSDMGKVMGLAKSQLSGKAEMAQVSSAIQAALK